MKKKNSKKPVRYTTKRGINLASVDERRNKTLTAILLFIAIVAIAAAVAKFGVLDLFAKRDAAQQQYDTVHTQFLASEKAIEEYDSVLLEYRTYSMDWMENDESGRYVSVARRDVLDVIEREMRTNGTVTGLNVNGNSVTVDMKGMNLSQISAMCTDLEDYPFIKSAVIKSAKTEEDKSAPAVETEDGQVVTERKTARTDSLVFQVLIEIQRAEEKEG